MAEDAQNVEPHSDFNIGKLESFSTGEIVYTAAKDIASNAIKKLGETFVNLEPKAAGHAAASAFLIIGSGVLWSEISHYTAGILTPSGSGLLESINQYVSVAESVIKNINTPGFLSSPRGALELYSAVAPFLALTLSTQAGVHGIKAVEEQLKK